MHSDIPDSKVGKTNLLAPIWDEMKGYTLLRSVSPMDTNCLLWGSHGLDSLWKKISKKNYLHKDYWLIRCIKQRGKWNMGFNERKNGVILTWIVESQVELKYDP